MHKIISGAHASFTLKFGAKFGLVVLCTGVVSSIGGTAIVTNYTC